MSDSQPSASEPCPSLESLEAFAAGQAVSPSTRDHVSACPTCTEAIQRIRGDNEFLASFCKTGTWPSCDPAESFAGVRFPGYDVVGELHRGGQGVVFHAVQHFTKRQVAIKIMRQGLLATTADRARFTREIETLGRLDHPNIVTVHDAGLVEGLRYFVMDYIDGRTLDEFVRAESDHSHEARGMAGSDAWDIGASTEAVETSPPVAIGPDRLQPTLIMFVKICDAVHAAHLKGVMHRDLKPSNIRVDETGEPHILDFGLAKSIDQIEGDMTNTGQFVGSLYWASPEQIEGASNRVDLRTDVYSLGAILFQLLTGDVPFDIDSSLRETVDNILHRDPERPSVLAAKHGLRIDNDLETIVLKCLAKDRDRRYQSVGELARDVRRYLANEAIDAKRDSAWYVLRKTAWRQRRALAVAAVPAILIPIALYGLHRSTIANQKAELEHSLRQIELGRNAAILEITRRLQARPDSSTDSPGGMLSSRNVDAIRNDLDTGSLPVSDHGVALLLAETLRDQGMVVEAEGLVRRSMYMLQREHGPRHPEIGRLRTVLADLLRRRGTRMNEARQTAELAVRDLTDAFGDSSPEIARALTVLARIKLDQNDVTGALDGAQRALEADTVPHSVQRVYANIMFVRVQIERGETTSARDVFLGTLRDVLLFAHDTDACLLDALEFGSTLIEHGIVRAEDVFDPSALPAGLAEFSPPAALREAVAVLRGGSDGTARDEHVVSAQLVMIIVREKILGSNHPSLGASLASAAGAMLAESLATEGRNPKRIELAVPLFRRAIDLQIAANGPDSPLVGKSYEKIATCMSILGRLREATQWYARDCELWKRQPPELSDDFQILVRTRWTAWHATRAGEYELGLRWTDTSLEILERTLGLDDGGAALILSSRALCLAKLDRAIEAQANDALAVKILDSQTVPADQRTECGRLLGLTRLSLGQVENARAIMEPAWETAQPIFDSEHGLYRMEWSHTMLQYCKHTGELARAEQFARILNEEATGDFLDRESDNGN
jgi:serine/threonine protein kinase